MCLQVNGPFSIGGHSGVIQLADALAFVVAEMYTITVSAKVYMCVCAYVCPCACACACV